MLQQQPVAKAGAEKGGTRMFARMIEKQPGLVWLGIEIESETLFALDHQILGQLRHHARNRKDGWLAEGCAVRLVRSTVAAKIAKQRGIAWKSQRHFAERLVEARIRHFAASGVIHRQSRFSRANRYERPGYVIPVDYRLTEFDVHFLADLLIRWDAPAGP